MSRSRKMVKPDASVEAAKPTAKRVRLKIFADTPFTEIRLLDASFKPVPLPANLGSAEVGVVPGLYEVGFRTDACWESRHVVAGPDASELEVRQAPSVCADAGRVAHATLSCEEAAAGLHTDGATVIVSLRADGAGPSDVATAQAFGLSDMKVTLIGADQSSAIAHDLAEERPCTWRFAVAPGFWRLRINEAHPRHPFEMGIAVAPRYVTHVSAPMRAVGERLCVDLENVRVRLLRPDCGAMNDDLIQFEEAALKALAGGHALYGPAIEGLINDLTEDKAVNPMLGIFAAHLCELSQKEDVDFHDRLLTRLERLTGAPAIRHPDVAILRLASMNRRGMPLDAEPPILFPPVLAASWRLLLEVAARQPSLVPAGSLSERIADRLWSSRLWTAWTAPPLETQAAPSTRAIAPAEPDEPTAILNPAGLAETIASLLDQSEVREWFRAANRAGVQSSEGLAWDDADGVTQAEAAVATALYPVDADEKQQSELSRLADRRQAGSPASQAADPAKMADWLGLPRATVERALSSLAEKLGVQASNLNIDF